MYVCRYIHNHLDLYMQQHDQIPLFYTLRKKESKLLGQAITRGRSVSTQGTFDSCSLVFWQEREDWREITGCCIQFHGLKWCKLINTKSTAFPWSCCAAKGWQQQHNPLTYGGVTTCSWTLQLPCAHTASFSAFVSCVSFTHPNFPELLMGFNLNS